jgi:bacterioferritin (cytochrome b1)
MVEALVTAGIAALTGMTVITQRLHTRISELDRRLDGIELRVAQDYVTKGELAAIMERMEAHLIRIEDKMDNIANRC